MSNATLLTVERPKQCEWCGSSLERGITCGADDFKPPKMEDARRAADEVRGAHSNVRKAVKLATKAVMLETRGLKELSAAPAPGGAFHEPCVGFKGRRKKAKDTHRKR